MSNQQEESFISSCVLCSSPVYLDKKDTYNKLKKKGLDGCNIVRALHNQPEIEFNDADHYAHIACRKKWVNHKYISSASSKAQANNDRDEAAQSHSPQPEPCSSNIRSKSTFYDVRADCLLCGEYIDQLMAQKHPDRQNLQYSRVEKLTFCENLRHKCNERQDSWALEIQERVTLLLSDFIAEEVMYHRNCHRDFYKNRQRPEIIATPFSSPPTKKPKAGKSEDMGKMEALDFAIRYLEENDNDTITLEELYLEMKRKSGLPDHSLYSTKQMLLKLKNHYGEKVSSFSTRHQTTIVTLTSNLKDVINDTHRNASKTDSSIESIIQDVGSYIRAEVKQMKTEKDVYPEAIDIKDKRTNLEYVSPSLLLLLRCLIKSKNSDILVASLGQAIMQAICPRSFLPPLQVGVAVTLEHNYGSRALVDLISSLGFCSSYSEADRYRKNAALSQGVCPEEGNLLPDTFIQWSADNVDHGSLTLDGRNQIHMMGMMAAFTPAFTGKRKIPRKERIDHRDIIEAGNVRIVGQSDPKYVLQNLKYTKIKEMQKDRYFCKLDFLWSICRNPSMKNPQPQWTGFMISILPSRSHPGKCSELFLPMIDLKPSDPTCVRSTLEYVVTQAETFGQDPILTFDQQLWWVATLVIQSQPEGSKLRRTVLILGGFHEEMSALGTIGNVMDGSGIKEVLSTVYAEGSVEAMMSGKSVARAFRGHQLLDTALNLLTLSKALNLPLNLTGHVNLQTETAFESSHDSLENTVSSNAVSSSAEQANLMSILSKLDAVKMGQMTLEDLLVCGELNNLGNVIREWRNNMKLSSRTAALWIQYQDMVASVRQLVFSARTGNWELYMNSHYKLLRYLAATGHNNYTKSLVLFLQKMEDLPTTHPEIYKYFMEGKFVVRRSDKYFSGIFGDLHMEQVYMGYIKSPGGLTRGRGFSELTRLTYFMSMPTCAEVSKAIYEVSGTSRTEAIHKDLTDARIKRDTEDVEKITNYLILRDPFDETPELRSIASGITADATVNCDKAEEAGDVIIRKMEGKSVHEHSFQRKDQIKNLASVRYIVHEGETIEIDPQILFQRLVMVGQRSMEITEMFSYELCSYPASLFDKHVMMRPPNKKSELFRVLIEMTSGSCILKTEQVGLDTVHVVDGGNLLHKLPWAGGSTTYGQICDVYVEYVLKSTSPTVVFDGYPEYSTKDETHLRRKGNKVSVPIMIGKEKLVDVQKKPFLANEINKQRFINLLGESMMESGICVEHAEADADVLIVNVAIERARRNTVVLEGKDTDLPVLILYKYDVENMKDIILHGKQFVSMKKMKTELQNKAPHLIENLLFLHAFSGCDTCCTPLGIGKPGTIKKALKLAPFAAIFMNSNASKQQIYDAGERAMCILYGLKHISLDIGRSEKYRERVATATQAVDVQTLPPTSDACKQHSLRVYHQVQAWLENDLQPTDFGWEERLLPSGKISLRPIRMTKEPAPSDLLKIIRCTCTEVGCSSNQCSCFKVGLHCTKACRNCKGTSCHNTGIVDLSEEDALQY